MGFVGKGYDMKIISFLILALGVLSLVYYGVIISYAGTGSSFSWFWLVLGILCISIFAIMTFVAKHKIHIPKTVQYLFAFIVLAGLSIFLLIEGLIIYHAKREVDPNMDYLIVLGAQVRGTTITNSLYQRLKVANLYLNDNPKTLVIVSGGQGPGEDITEAMAMKNYLLENGIEEERILLEDQSTNTSENILYSKRLIAKSNAKVAVVTNGFHVFRSISIARKQGLESVQALSAPSDPILFISYYVREVLGVAKDFILGNM